ncbi:hypothetical protein [Embleya sp. NBC_00896]|uniref:hypothetical protein n=1 Tax=Embleya sp. NBC_00896 TaxID=2975961 RepID=UPI00386D28C8|nr:hypothetical protein OG928_47230 [Embleya sp. NBC_00896]
MADIKETQAFKTLAARTEAELLTRRLDVVPAAVHDVLAHAVTTVAAHLDVQPRAALRHIKPSVIADRIAEAGDPAAEGAEDVHSVRPLRTDERKLSVPRWLCSRPLMALTQTVKYACANGDSRTVQHAADLAYELGVVIGTDPDQDRVEIPLGVLDETTHILEHVADRIDTGGWSLHGARTDTTFPAALRRDAELVRRMRAKADI